jgi:hypothetical protein
LATRMQARSLRILFQVLLVVFAVQMVGKALVL